MKAAGYVRVSTGQQAEQGLSLDEQQRRVRAFAEAHGWELADLFVEGGVSGRRDERPELNRLLERVSEFDAIIVPKLDRLGRRARRLLELYDELERHGVRLVSVADNIDTATPAGRLLRTVLAAVAEFESDLIGERTAAVQEARARAGKHHGGPVPYGYRLAEGGGLEPEPAEAEVVRRIFREAAEGRSQRAIAHGLTRDGLTRRRGVRWSQARVRDTLRNPVYAGRVRLHGKVYPGLHEALVEPELFDRLEAARAGAKAAGHAGRGRPPKGRHLFTKGLLRCAHCGYAMAPRTATDGSESYVCLGRVQNGAEFCPMRQVPRAALDTAALHYFGHLALDVKRAQADLEAQLRARRTEARVLLEDAEHDLATWTTRKENAQLDYMDGKLTVKEWRELAARVNEELEKAERRVRLLRDRLHELERGDVAEEARQEALRRVSELRSAVAGEIASAEGLEAVRTQLWRLFERFDIGRTDLPPDPDMPREMVEARERALEEAKCEQVTVGDGTWVVLPWPRPEVIDPLETEWAPALRTEPPSPSGKNSRSGPSPAYSPAWPAFAVTRSAAPRRT